MSQTPDVSVVPPRFFPILVTGTAGVAGFGALRYLQARYPGNVFGIVEERNRDVDAPDVYRCNVENRTRLGELFRRHEFKTVLHCAGNCALKPCELDPALARRINVEGVENMLRQVVPRGVRLIFLSCDLVYSGTGGGNHVETDPPDPVTVYGKTMAEAERLLLGEYPPACILRISLPMGVSPNGHAGAVDWILYRFRNKRPATLYFDEVRTPTYTRCMNRAFERLISAEHGGLFHFGGPRKVSLYEIGQIVNRLGGFAPELLKGIPRVEAGPMPPRAGNVTMDSSKLIEALGESPFHPWPSCDTLVPTDRRWHYERPWDQPRSIQEVYRRLCLEEECRGEA